MSVEQNKTAVRTIVEEIWNKGDVSKADDHIAPDYFYKGPFGEFRGPDGFRQMVIGFRAIFPDLIFTVDDMVGEGDKLAVRVTFTGTMKGEMMGIPPTGKKVNLKSAYFYRFLDGKEVEALPFGDMLAMYQQMGIPIPQQ